MSSGPEGEQQPSPSGRIYDGICSYPCVTQEPLDVAGGSIYDNTTPAKMIVRSILSTGKVLRAFFLVP